MERHYAQLYDESTELQEPMAPLKGPSTNSLDDDFDATLDDQFADDNFSKVQPTLAAQDVNPNPPTDSRSRIYHQPTTSYRGDEIAPTDYFADDDSQECGSHIQSQEPTQYEAVSDVETDACQCIHQEHISSDEDSIDERTDAELAAVALEIQDLEDSVPLLKTSYHLLDRLGEGTFSSVYKAIDLHHVLYDNSQWATCEETYDPLPTASSDARNFASTNTCSSSSSILDDANPSRSSVRIGKSAMSVNPVLPPFGTPCDPFAALAGEQATNTFTETLQRHALECGKLPIAYKSSRKGKKKHHGNVYVALKRIYVTSSPHRILNELELMTQLRGARNVSYLIQAIRHEDQVIAIMPYRKHQDFRDYYRIASLSTIRSYLRCMFTALQDTHAKGIIHRDIKPANFLFDLNTKQGVLCDFGLAEKFQPNDWHGKCLHSLPEPKLHDFHGQSLTTPRPTHEQKLEQWKRWEKRLEKCKANFVQRLGRPLKHEAEFEESREFQNLFAKIPFDHEPDEEELTNAPSQDWYEAWQPPSKTGGLSSGEIGKRKLHQVSNTSDLLGHGFERVGYKREDTRPGARANRAGTRGFRAPEVLLKCPDQTGAVDIWSVGITLLCFLTRRFPFFNSNDDTDALMEIATVFGRSRLNKCAAAHNRTLICNIPEVNTPRFKSFHNLVRTLNPTIYEEQKLKFDSATSSGIDRSASILYEAHKTFSAAVEGRGVELNPYDEPWYAGSELWHLVDLLKKTLDLDCTQRITPSLALKHKFFVDYN